MQVMRIWTAAAGVPARRFHPSVPLEERTGAAVLDLLYFQTHMELIPPPASLPAAVPGVSVASTESGPGCFPDRMNSEQKEVQAGIAWLPFSYQNLWLYLDQSLD